MGKLQDLKALTEISRNKKRQLCEELHAVNKEQYSGKYRGKATCNAVFVLMSKGQSMVQVASFLGVTTRTLRNWFSDPRKPEFKEAVERGKVAAEAFWEDIGMRGMVGEIKDFKPATWQFYMKSRFHQDWADINRSEIEIKNGPTKLSDEEIEDKIKEYSSMLDKAKEKEYNNDASDEADED